MVFSFLFAAMIVLLLLLPGAAGIVLLIVGLARKRPALWGTGIGLLALALLAVVVGAGYVLLASAPRVTGPMAMGPGPTVVSGFGSAPADEFSSHVGVDLPDTAEVVASQSRSSSYGSGKSFYLATLRVDPLFDRLLKKHFQPATWDDVRAAMTGAGASGEYWDPDETKGKAYYTRSFSGTREAPFTAEIHLVHDAEAGTVHLVSTRKPKE